MGLTFEYQPGQTPIDEDEKEGLLIPAITTRSELDELEQQNIENAIQWTLSRNFKADHLLSEPFVKQLHLRMYGEVWDWAGNFRKTNKNIGVDKWQIQVALTNLLNDTLFWIKHNSFLPDEIALRFKHRLVAIHCFPNGNGRHSRLIADLIISKLFKQPEFTWGATGCIPEKEIRDRYLQALHVADEGNYQLLLDFARM